MRSIPDPGFAGDHGGADPVVAAALAVYDRAGEAEEVSEHSAVLAALQDARVLVPVVAVLGEVEYDVPPGGRAPSPGGRAPSPGGRAQSPGGRAPSPGGRAQSRPAHDKTSDMAAVLMTGRDGRTALLAFTGTASLTSWNPEARPVPVTVRQAAQAALQDDASALLVDVAGPVLFVVEGDDLRALAGGDRLVRLEDGRWGWLSPLG